MKNFVTNHEQIVDEDEEQVHFTLFAEGDFFMYKEASYDEKWQKAMAKEIEFIGKNETWELTNLSLGHEAIDLKWIYGTKLKLDDSMEKYKARVVAKGFKQKGVDYNEVFAQAEGIIDVSRLQTYTFAQ